MSAGTVSLAGFLKVALVAAVLVYLAIVAVLYLGQRQLMYPAWALPAGAGDEPAPPGVAVVEVTTADGERLRGLWRAPAPGAPLVVGFHGNAATPAPYADRFANDPPWADLGAGVLVVAYRGYPGSTGSPSEEGLLADARAAAAFATARAPGSPLVIYGHSLGAAVAVALATEVEADLLYLEAPFTSARRVAGEAYPFAPTVLLKDAFETDRRLPSARAARVLIVHGEADGVIPVAHGEALADVRPGAVLLRLPGAGHVSVLGRGDDTAVRMLAEAGGETVDGGG